MDNCDRANKNTTPTTNSNYHTGLCFFNADASYALDAHNARVATSSLRMSTDISHTYINIATNIQLPLSHNIDASTNPTTTHTTMNTSVGNWANETMIMLVVQPHKQRQHQRHRHHHHHQQLLIRPLIPLLLMMLMKLMMMMLRMLMMALTLM